MQKLLVVLTQELSSSEWLFVFSLCYFWSLISSSVWVFNGCWKYLIHSLIQQGFPGKSISFPSIETARYEMWMMLQSLWEQQFKALPFFRIFCGSCCLFILALTSKTIKCTYLYEKHQRKKNCVCICCFLMFINFIRIFSIRSSWRSLFEAVEDIIQLDLCLCCLT